jgi:hypothetical protein
VKNYIDPCASSGSQYMSKRHPRGQPALRPVAAMERGRDSHQLQLRPGLAWGDGLHEEVINAGGSRSGGGCVLACGGRAHAYQDVARMQIRVLHSR